MDALVDALADASVDVGNEDGAAMDAAPSCTPFETAAPIPVSLGPCARTLAREELPTETRNEDGVEIRANIPFATRGDYVLHGDLHLPEAREGTGAIVIIHGGGWLDCDNRRTEVSGFAQGIASVLGVPAFNIDYRLAQEGGGYPNNVMDVKCALQWLRQESEALGIDADRIGVLGTSAGAHLALMAALTSDRADLDPACADAPTDVSLALAYAPPTDLPRFVTSDSLANEAPRFYTGETCDDPVRCLSGRGCTRCVDASPLAHACRPKETRVVLLQAPDPYDRLVAQIQSEVLADALRDAGTPVDLRIPSDAEMRAAGCTPEGGSHAADGCMIRASQDLVNPLLLEFLGPR